MKKLLFLTTVSVAVAASSSVAVAQSVIYRCGNEYLNDAAVAVARGCKVVEGGHITVVPGANGNRVEKTESILGDANVSARSDRRNGALTSKQADGTGLRNRDPDAHSILLAELKTAEARLAEQQQEYNKGAPEKLAGEADHPQRYLDRVYELNEGVHRYTGDIAALKREIARLPAALSMPK